LTTDFASVQDLRRSSGSFLPLKIVAAFFLLIKLTYVFTAGPIADEAYYWLWGQHPGWSYFDHPPFNAWMLGLMDLLLGRSLFGLRALTLVTLALTFHIFYLWAKRLAASDWQSLFWPGVVIYLASPTFGFFTSLAQHDYMLVFLGLASGHFFISFLAEIGEGRPGRLRDLYCGALLLGLAGLTKYTGVLIGIALIGYVAAAPRLRTLFRNPHFYAAGLLALLMQAPILIWNVSNGFASFQFHLSDRHPAGWLTRINWEALSEFLVVSALLISPFLIPAFARVLMARTQEPFERTARGLGIWLFWISSLLFLAVSLFDRVWWWWNLLAYVLLLPLVAKYMGRGVLFWGHVGLGAVLQVFLLVSSSLVPLSMLVGIDDATRKQLFGWEQLIEPVEAAERTYNPDFIATMTSETGGILAFALDDPEVTALTPARNQFDYWFNGEAHRGDNALIVLRDGYDLAYVASRFDTVSAVSEIPIQRFGLLLGTYSVYWATGFKPEG
jgi:4-amino-4-deoxy-L-arabinose transferase-like glycosyltransferase